MPATLNRPGVLCDFCEALLTGGIDTYGGVGQSLCFLCWTTDERAEPVMQQNRKEFLDKRLKVLEAERDDLDDQISKLKERMYAIEHELNGKGKCKEQETTTP